MLKIAFATLLSFYFFPAFPQTFLYKHPSISGVHFVQNDFKNPSVAGKFKNMDAGLSISYLKGISPRFDWQVSFTGSFPDSTFKSQAVNGKKSLLLQTDLSWRTRLFAKATALQPYFFSGIGASHHKSNYGAYILAGPGMEVSYKDIFILLNAQYRIGVANTYNSHYYYSLGIAGILSRSKKKKTASQPFSQTYISRDRDGDGILDSVDNCPDQPGLSRFKGCPDTDNDGIADKEDSCPIVFGYERYKGCPVPDRDKDGVNDEEDQCADVVGIKENKGCPPTPKELTNRIELAAKNIFFKTGSHELISTSFPSLNEIARILKTHPLLTLSIEGHTDNTGDAGFNQLLSENRARAVLEYLLSSGIAVRRLSSAGYGEQKPVADNATPDGRAKNRRVEMKVR
jgi:OmpA-OmpF porin, OOP family